MPKSTETLITVNPDGTISADFTGHISAAGIDLLAGTDVSPPTDRKIRWHDLTLTGAALGEVWTGIDAVFGGVATFLRGLGDAANQAAETLLEAVDFAGNFSRLGVDSNGQIFLVSVNGARKILANLAGDSYLAPIGTILLWSGDNNTANVGAFGSTWLLADGSSVLKATFPRLFAICGAKFGAGDATHFVLPDLRGRAAIGQGQGVGLTTRNVGDLIGEEVHALPIAEMPTHTHTGPSHTHTGPSHNHTGVVGGVLSSLDHLHVAVGVGNSYGFTNQPPALTWGVAGGGGASYITGISATTGAADRSLDHQHGIVADGTAATGASGTAASGATGGAGNPTHNNMQPSLALTYVIRAA